MFKNLFGGKKDKKNTNTNVNIQETIKNLDKKINDMELLLNNYETRSNALQEEAKKKIKAGDKNGAKRILVKKKKLVDQIKTYEGAIMMMEEQKGMLESAAATKDMIDTVKKANAVIKENKVDIEQLEQVKEDMDELKDQQAEMNDFFKDYADENQEGVEDDLKALEEEMEKEASQNLPMANKEKISTKEKIKNEENELEKFMMG
jgi:DNA repair exonuclease SbcCD ATPase subunit